MDPIILDLVYLLSAVGIVLGITFLVRWIQMKLGIIDSVFGDDFKDSK